MQLEDLIYAMLAARAQTAVELDHAVLSRHPRIWRGAVAATVLRLHRQGWLERQGVRWKAKGRPVLTMRRRAHASR